jgi:hypothetical protein
MAGFSITACGRVLDFAPHAVERFYERCRPGLPDVDAAAVELARLAESIGVVVNERPAWMNGAAEQPTRYLMLGPDVALPMQGRMVLTCVSRGTASDAALAERRELRRVRAEARQRRRGRGSRAAEGNEARPRVGAGARKRRREDA